MARIFRYRGRESYDTESENLSLPRARIEAAVKQKQNPANTVAGTAQRRQPVASSQAAARPQQRPSSAASQATTYTNPASRSNANPMVAPHLPEVCPQCQSRFATVARLVQHVEDFHPAQGAGRSAPARGGGGGMGGGGGGMSQGALWPGARSAAPQGDSAAPQQDQFQCPHCAAVFFNPVRLVQHQESCRTQQQQTPSGSRGSKGSKDGCLIC
eukprot:gene2331-8625_t